MRRRRRTKYTWLPTIGGDTFPGPGDRDFVFNGITRQLSLPSSGGPTTLDIFPVIADNVRDVVGNEEGQLVDFVGSTLFLKRIVGKCHVWFQQSNQNGDTQPAAVISAGFFIARQHGDQSVGFFPVGLQDGDNVDDFDEYSPAGQPCIREPWIWRRTWILGNNLTQLPVTESANGAFFPATNASRSVLDGPHIDAKTARRTQNDERLWFAWQAHSLIGASTLSGTSVALHLDCRYLGAVRRQKNRSAF